MAGQLEGKNPIAGAARDIGKAALFASGATTKLAMASLDRPAKQMAENAEGN